MCLLEKIAGKPKVEVIITNIITGIVPRINHNEIGLSIFTLELYVERYLSID